MMLNKTFVRGLICFLVSTSSSSVYAQKNTKVVFVIVDGIPADVIEKVSTPYLDSIAGASGYTHAHVGGRKDDYSQTPTISAVGYNSLLTGTWVNKHNVWDNDIAKPDYHYPTIFKLFKEQYPKKKIAVFSSWQDNRTKLVGDGLPQTKSLKVDLSFDGLELDTTKYPHDKARQYMHLIDESVVQQAAETIANEAPDLSWVYLEYTDDMGHMHGDSEQFYEAVKLMDKQMGKLWTAIKARTQKDGEDWQIYVTTDHGRDAKTGKGHGGQSERERNTWIVTNARDLNDYYKNGNPGIVDIAPSIARFMKLKIPRDIAMEMDGIPLTGKISAVDPEVSLSGTTLNISWKNINPAGTAKIWVSTTNDFQQGKKDVYHLLASVPVSSGKTTVDVSRYPSKFYKVVIETPSNFLSRWAGDGLVEAVLKRK